MQERVHTFVNKFDKVLEQTADYAGFLAELKRYKALVLQLPEKISFPMFEVGLRIVNHELLRRIDQFIFTILSSFEDALADNS